MDEQLKIILIIIVSVSIFGLLVFGIALTTAIPIDGEFKTLIICSKRLDVKSSQIHLNFIFNKGDIRAI